MASASRHLCRGFRLASRVTPAKRKCFTPLVQTQRYASTGKSKLPDPIIFSDLDDLLSEAGIRRRDFEAVDPSEYMVPEDPLKPSDLPEDERATYEALPAEEQEKQLAVLNHYKALAESDLEDEQQNALGPEEIAAIVRRTEAEVPFKMEIDRATSPRTGAGYWAEDEEDPYGQFADADNDFFETDISSIAENQLQLHREVRQYSRVAAWEMPLLASMTPVPVYNSPITNTHRTRQTYVRTNSRHSSPLPLHNLPRRNTSSRQKSRGGIHHHRPRQMRQPHRTTTRQTPKSPWCPLQPHYRQSTHFLREIP